MVFLIVIMLNKKEQKKLIDLMLENAKKDIKCFEYKVAYQKSKIKEILDFLKTVLIKTKLAVDEFELDGGKKITTLDAIIGYAGIDKDKFMKLQKTIDKNNIKPTYIYLPLCINIHFYDLPYNDLSLMWETTETFQETYKKYKIYDKQYSDGVYVNGVLI